MGKIAALLLLLASQPLFVQAQTDADSGSIAKKIEDLTSKISKLEKGQKKCSELKFSGYIMGQFQVAESDGAHTYAGGNFAPGTDKRFMVRRGRAKLNYARKNADGDLLTSAYVQIDYTQSGLALRDAYVTILEPHTRWVGLKVGAMNKPFSYELTYSSSVRETPERGRMSQILLPGEKDLGAQIFIEPNKTSRWRFFRLEAGMYNGTGVTNHDYDRFKDLISRLTFYKNNKSKSVKYSGGLSYYNGGHRNGTKYIDQLLTDGVGNHYWSITDSASGNLDKRAKQIYYGVDAEVTAKWAAGRTTLRAEYIWGTQGGTASSSSSPRVAVTTNTYQREFDGAYFYFIQNILGSKHNFVVKYDWYDPNVKVTEKEIGVVTGTGSLTAADIRYNTLGLGYYYTYDEDWKFVLHYDIVKNDATKLANYDSDLKDNVLTLRVMYSF